MIDVNYYDEVGFLSSKQRDWRKWIEKLLLLAQNTVAKNKQQMLSIHFVNAAKSRAVNNKYRQQDHSTDVISFAIEDGQDQLDLSSLFAEPNFREDLGDLFMCPQVITRHSKEYGTGFDREFGYTIVHGYLHLSGYDHIKPEEAKKMFGIQGQILKDYGLPLRLSQLDKGRGK